MGRHSTSLSLQSPSYVASPLLSSKLDHEISGARDWGRGEWNPPGTKHTHAGVTTCGYPYVQWFTERDVRGGFPNINVSLLLPFFPPEER